MTTIKTQSLGRMIIGRCVFKYKVHTHTLIWQQSRRQLQSRRLDTLKKKKELEKNIFCFGSSQHFSGKNPE